MLDHIAIRAADFSMSEHFYRTMLAALEIEPSGAGGGRIEWDDFSIVPADIEHPSTRHLHLAFVAPSRAHVDAFWQTGADAGYEDAGQPGERPQYTPGYYGAFIRDPDGNSAEAVHHADVRRGGHIDHLWIRVPALEAAAAFYETISPHVGLRRGRRWEAGRQFRGAWATFSLVDDGAPHTRSLDLAFPAPDRQAVNDFHRAATTAGYRDNGPPAARSCPPDSYAAGVLDPAGVNVEAVFRERR